MPILGRKRYPPDMDATRTGGLNAAVALELRTLRYRQGITVEDFAKRSGIGARTMPRYLNGTRQIGTDQLQAMCRVLGISPDELVRRAIANMDPPTELGSAAETG